MLRGQQNVQVMSHRFDKLLLNSSQQHDKEICSFDKTRKEL